jgi:hypothetical protein
VWPRADRRDNGPVATPVVDSLPGDTWSYRWLVEG